ncbi:MAG TPA: enoyl-CoA hydratase-related protein [Acidimicrobiales bacterium]|nr:enoyl-CoA hydratase-related protein [Acidimicrobiales bacterium]
MVEFVNEPPWPQATTVIALDDLGPIRAADLAALEERRRPVLAVVRGQCSADALALACMVDLLVAAPTASFGRPGPWTDLVLRRLSGITGRKVAGYLALSGRMVDAGRACRWGLVSSLAENPAHEAVPLAESLDRRSPVAVEVVLQRAHRGAAADHLRSGLMSWPWSEGAGT